MNIFVELSVSRDSDVVSCSTGGHWRLLVQPTHGRSPSDGRPWLFRTDQLDRISHLLCDELRESVTDICRRPETTTKHDGLFKLSAWFYQSDVTYRGSWHLCIFDALDLSAKQFECALQHRLKHLLQRCTKRLSACSSMIGY